MKRAGIIAAAAVCAVLIFVLARSFGRNPHEVPFGLKGKPAPAFKLRRLGTGEEVQLAALRGKPVVINFWASWCRPCAQEHPVLEWAADRFGQHVTFVGVVFEDTDENASKFLSEYGSRYAQLGDPRSQTAVDFGVAGVPETYFLDANGVIQDKHVGPLDPDALVAQLERVGAPVGDARP